jgi:hypothetical protein
VGAADLVGLEPLAPLGGLLDQQPGDAMVLQVIAADISKAPAPRHPGRHP